MMIFTHALQFNWLASPIKHLTPISVHIYAVTIMTVSQSSVIIILSILTGRTSTLCTHMVLNMSTYITVMPRVVEPDVLQASCPSV